ncbi:GNAT superfamily N-acetyltransferase [Microbacterium sp. SORGH_AS428]|uniref:GNAT family N-acetyltransferase n=1 Tax=Microbacterium sp. SORGH_AS_0428 TaxID=3041788 RepID=UPI00285B06AF|nr:GNAT family N-acetyltransferase [Microbacterium sp. SORGH_AS_0428]MDR6200193.1 GNAT superfamily N-acetyltransferase [Microbacterium sp. SORGH_AS_0428]
MSWSLRASTPDDAAWIAELRAEVMRPDLERLDRYDPVYVRQRFLRAFDPAFTRVIVVDDQDAGSIAVRPASDGVWVEHFYLATAYQGRGIGSQVLALVLEEHTGDTAFRLNVLQGSPARRLYERHGFVLYHEDEIDAFLQRAPAAPLP